MRSSVIFLFFLWDFARCQYTISEIHDDRAFKNLVDAHMKVKFETLACDFFKSVEGSRKSSIMRQHEPKFIIFIVCNCHRAAVLIFLRFADTPILYTPRYYTHFGITHTPILYTPQYYTHFGITHSPILHTPRYCTQNRTGVTPTPILRTPRY